MARASFCPVAEISRDLSHGANERICRERRRFRRTRESLIGTSGVAFSRDSEWRAFFSLFAPRTTRAR
eukprot:5600856-Pleurochrysis_carterae.AAC.1